MLWPPDVICAAIGGSATHLTGLPHTLGALCGGMLVLETTNTRIKSGYFLPPPGWQTPHFLSKKKIKGVEGSATAVVDSFRSGRGEASTSAQSESGKMFQA